jgi:hypothetical protein
MHRYNRAALYKLLSMQAYCTPAFLHAMEALHCNCAEIVGRTPTYRIQSGG